MFIPKSSYSKYLSHTEKKTTYIYLNSYLYNGSLVYYVGSHTWFGPKNTLDPFYIDSSTIVAQFHLTPYSRLLLYNLEYPSSNFESEAIDYYCKKLGLSPIIEKFSMQTWYNLYPHFGVMINLHK